MWVFQNVDAETVPLIFRVSPGAVKTIGRAPSVDLVLDVALVSRVHCRLEAGDDGVDVVDLESTNGTYVNDARVARGRLTDGDRLRVGRVELRVTRSS